MFQQTLNRDIPRAVAGDFASTNPRFNMLAGEGALVTAEDVLVGGFAFADLDTGEVYQGSDTGRRVGFVFRNNQAIVNPGESASMTLPVGREAALMTEGDFYTVFDADVTVGAEVYATAATGEPTITATDNIETSFVVAENRAAGELVKITTSAI